MPSGVKLKYNGFDIIVEVLKVLPEQNYRFMTIKQLKEIGGDFARRYGRYIHGHVLIYDPDHVEQFLRSIILKKTSLIKILSELLSPAKYGLDKSYSLFQITHDIYEKDTNGLLPDGSKNYAQWYAEALKRARRDCDEYKNKIHRYEIIKKYFDDFGKWISLGQIPFNGASQDVMDKITAFKRELRFGTNPQDERHLSNEIEAIIKALKTSYPGKTITYQNPDVSPSMYCETSEILEGVKKIIESSLDNSDGDRLDIGLNWDEKKISVRISDNGQIFKRKVREIFTGGGNKLKIAKKSLEDYCEWYIVNKFIDGRFKYDVYNNYPDHLQNEVKGVKHLLIFKFPEAQKAESSRAE